MKFLIVFILALCTASAFRMANSKLGIYKGTDAAVGQFPYQVGLSLKLGRDLFMWCGGSLIGRKWVLTAAHCTNGALSVIVYLGSTKRKNAEIKYTISPKKIFEADFDEKALKNDIALIRIPTTVETPNIKVVKLPAISNSYSSYAGDKAIASGWGYISDSRLDFPSDLKWGSMQIITLDDCVKKYGNKMTSSHLCVSTVGSASPCTGDSGGPLVLESSKVLIGVTSSSNEAGCTTGSPAIFARVTSHLDWIKDITGISY